MEIFGCIYGTSRKNVIHYSRTKMLLLTKNLNVILFLVLFNKLLAPFSEMECQCTVFSKPQKGSFFTASKFQHTNSTTPLAKRSGLVSANSKHRILGHKISLRVKERKKGIFFIVTNLF